MAIMYYYFVALRFPVFTAALPCLNKTYFLNKKKKEKSTKLLIEQIKCYSLNVYYYTDFHSLSRSMKLAGHDKILMENKILHKYLKRKGRNW